MSNVVFEVREPGQFENRGFYRSPDIMFGYLQKNDLQVIKRLAEVCDYVVVPDPEREPSKVQIFSKDLQRWGFIRKLWNQRPDLNGAFGSQFVYGFFSGKRFISKYSINENIVALMNVLSSGQITQEGLLPVRIKDLETGVIHDQIASLYD